MKKKRLDNQKINSIKKEASQFKTFISRGNVVDMAVGVIVGGAFGKIVTSLVNDLLMPLVGVFLGGLNFSELHIKIGESKILYGSFIQTILDFLIISFCIFMVVQLFERLKKKEVVENKDKKKDEVLLLEEIRDLLKEQSK